MIIIENSTKFWILANKEWIQGRDKQEVYSRYLKEVDKPLSINGLSVKIKVLLDLVPTYEDTKYIYKPTNLELNIPEREFIVGEETKDVYEFIKEMNPDKDFSQQDLNAYLYRNYKLNYKQYKRSGKAVYKYIPLD